AASGDASLLSETSTATSLTTGLIDCASPESLYDPARRSVAGDQYGLGCSLFFGLTGRYPFAGSTVVERITAHEHTPPPPVYYFNPKVPPDLSAVIARLMQKAPNSRYPAIDDLVATLMSLARTIGSAPPVPAVPRHTTEATETLAVGRRPTVKFDNP